MVGTQSKVDAIDNTLVGLWFQQYSNRGVLYADSIVRCTADAEEIVQDAFYRLLNCLTQKPIESETRFRATFFTTIRNLSIDLLRKRKRQKNVSLQSVSEPAVESFAESQYVAARERIVEAIDRLPENWREAIQLKIHGTLSYDEIAETMNCTRAQVRTWIYRARRQLKEEFRKKGLLE